MKSLPVPDMDAIESRGLRKFLIALSKSRFFTISLFIHVMIVVLFGGTVLFQTFVEPEDFEGAAAGGFVEAAQAVQVPATAQPATTQPNPTVQPVSVTTAPTISALTTMNPSQATFAMPTMVPRITPGRAMEQVASAAPPISALGSGQMTAAIAGDIRSFTEGWGKGRTGSGTGSGLRQREFEFTAFLAKYRGGNWNSTVQIRNNKIATGSLPNMLYLMSELSGGRIKAIPAAEPLDLASDRIFSEKPPFIFFTGHRDFTLTDTEVANLQKYVRMGGAIWGDSQLAGRRSRFDIAFRREMKRVIPDIDKDFEPLPADHQIFSSGYWADIKTTPPGVNYYQEPVYAMRYLGQIAIFYTANNYGDMWQMGLNKEMKFDMRRDAQGRYVAINNGLYSLRGTYIHNIDEASVQTAFKFGTNIIMHLITRWEDQLRAAPRL